MRSRWSGATRSRHGDNSITRSARANIDGGTATPSALAVRRLITSSIAVACSIGIAAGFAPFRTIAICSAARRYETEKFAP
jgi:hypothetical protein